MKARVRIKGKRQDSLLREGNWGWLSWADTVLLVNWESLCCLKKKLGSLILKKRHTANPQRNHQLFFPQFVTPSGSVVCSVMPLSHPHMASDRFSLLAAASRFVTKEQVQISRSGYIPGCVCSSTGIFQNAIAVSGKSRTQFSTHLPCSLPEYCSSGMLLVPDHLRNDKINLTGKKKILSESCVMEVSSSIVLDWFMNFCSGERIHVQWQGKDGKRTCSEIWRSP